MRKKNAFFVYTCMWGIAILALMALLIQNMGDARVVNYSGIVRGATQKLVKEEMNGQPDDPLLLMLDGIIDNLRTGEGEFDLRRNGDRAYQEQLWRLDGIWEQVKKEIYRVRAGETSPEALYALSQEHFAEADRMVLLAEQSSDSKLIRFIVAYLVVLLVSVCVFTILNERNRRALENSIYTDNLTGILNREGFEARAAQLLGLHGGERYCLMELDIDDFKYFNNSAGFELGDKLLQTLAGGLQARYHTGALCARIDADDFVILTERSPEAVEELRDCLAALLREGPLANVSEFITFTVGGYELTGGEEIHSVMDKANMAHKSAKAAGKSETVWYSGELLDPRIFSDAGL